MRSKCWIVASFECSYSKTFFPKDSGSPSVFVFSFQGDAWKWLWAISWQTLWNLSLKHKSLSDLGKKMLTTAQKETTLLHSFSKRYIQLLFTKIEKGSLKGRCLCLILTSSMCRWAHVSAMVCARARLRLILRPCVICVTRTNCPRGLFGLLCNCSVWSLIS